MFGKQWRRWEGAFVSELRNTRKYANPPILHLEHEYMGKTFIIKLFHILKFKKKSSSFI